VSRLVLRIAVGILFVLIASVVIVQFGSASIRRSFERGISAHLGQAFAATERVNVASPAELDAVVARLRKESGSPVQLLAPDAPAIPVSVRGELRGGPQLSFRGHRRGWTAYLPVRGGSRVLVLGPMVLATLHRSYPVEAVAGGILAVVALTAFLVAAPVVRRLRGLERAAGRIGEGDLGARADASKNDAVGRVARRFNVMAGRVQDLLERQKGLLQAVSHELRTPVARLRFGLEMLLAAKTDEERERRAAALDQDVGELDALVDELLLYMRAGESALELRREPVPVSGALDVILTRLQELRPEIEVERELRRDVVVLADPRLFRRALQNLIANGLRHATRRLAIHVTPREGLVETAIEDDGAGVPEADRARIFEPFARLDDSRSRGSGGAGLGLAIARRIVESHGGAISVADAEGGGARFVTTWAAADTNRDSASTHSRRKGGGDRSD
jgi:two-component system sensor histidine kinase RstB